MSADWNWLLSEEYGADLVCRAVGLPGAMPSAPSPGEVCLRAVYQPAFHSEVVVTLAGDLGGGRVSIRSARTRLWHFTYALRQRQKPVTLDERINARARRPNAEPRVPPPEPICVEVVAEGEQWRRVASMASHAIERRQEGAAGIDGMTIDFFVRDGERLGHFQTWSPRAGLDAELARGVIELAVEVLRGHEIAAEVEALRIYVPE